MKTLLDPLKPIARDLVDKKLWPVAALLLAALVAIPLLIGGSSEEAPPAPAATAATAAAPDSKSLVKFVDPAVTDKDNRPGRVKDPFYDPPEPPAPPTAGAAQGASGATPAASRPASGGAGAPAGGTAAVQVPVQPRTVGPAQPVAESVHYRTEVRWYAAKVAKRRPLARLTPLGGLENTAALYLGVARSKGSYAVFLLGPNATSEGDAKCGDDTGCRVIGLKAGQSQTVTVEAPGGGAARRFHLEVVAVRAVTADAATARAMRLKVHADGRDTMRAMWQDRATAEALRPIQYDRDSGLLVKQAAAAGGEKPAK